MNSPAIPQTTDLVAAAFAEAAQDVIRKAIETNTPIIVCQDHRVVRLNPHTMQPVDANVAAGHEPRDPAK